MFRSLKSDSLAGEEYCLEKNLFVEQTIPEMVMRRLSNDEMARYRAPYPTRESRLPTLVWPREVPIKDDGQPADVCRVVERYSDWMATNDKPKLFIKAEPGIILRDGSELGVLPRLEKPDRGGGERTPFPSGGLADAIGQALRAFIMEVRRR